MPSNVQYASAADFPETLPLFPLPGVLLLPRGQIPLNIFEPRYIRMIDDTLADARLIGIIQPDPAQAANTALPAVYSVGCAGRLTQWAETGDGRYLVQLTGITRFRVLEEMTVTTPYRRARVDFGAFLADLEPRRGEVEVDRAALLVALRDYAEANRIAIDWDHVKEAPNEALVNALSMMAPFGAAEKQALLEAPDLRARAEMLVALAEIEIARDAGDGGRMQ